MKHYFSKIKKFTYISSMVLTGVILFIALSAFSINKTLLNPDFHKQLFNKNDIYSQAYEVIKNSINEFVEGFKKNSPKDYEQHKDVFAMLEKSITPEMVNYNLDNIREDTFQFFKGKRMFLPDIYLSNFAKYEPENNLFKSEDSKLSAEAISKIEKINLSAILLYINRNDITDQFILIKLVYFIMTSIPGISLLIFLFFLLVGFLSSSGIPEMLKWLKKVLLFSAALALSCSLALLIYIWLYLPSAIRFVAMSLPLKTEAIVSYIRDCSMNTAFYLLACSALMAAFSFLLKSINKKLPQLAPATDQKLSAIKSKQDKLRIVTKYLVIFLLFICIISAVSYNIYKFKSGCESNDFSAVVAKYKNTNKVTQVISAKDDTIYALQIKLADPKTGTPLNNIPVNISGKSNILKKEFNDTVPTDDKGIAKFILDEGTFRLSFIQSGFPAGFQIPSPFFFDLSSAGTTIITVNIDKAPEINKQKWGASEIEVLDKDNNPVPNLQLSISGSVSAPGNPDNVFSLTNSEGIAVFKLNEGNYSAVFTESYIPKKYQTPSGFKITVTPNSITRYTVRLVDIPAPKPPQKPVGPVSRTNTTVKKRN